MNSDFEFLRREITKDGIFTNERYSTGKITIDNLTAYGEFIITTNENLNVLSIGSIRVIDCNNGIIFDRSGSESHSLLFEGHGLDVHSIEDGRVRMIAEFTYIEAVNTIRKMLGVNHKRWK